MKKNLKKRMVAGVMAGAMLLGLGGCGAEEKKPEAATMQEPAETSTEDAIELGKLVDASFNLDGILEGEKDETVYAMADAYGNVNSVVVSEWLKNSEGAAEIKDRSTLTEIENVKGDETFTQNGEEITWQANGKPVYYQGKTDQELPVSVKVSYKLDGKEVEPSTLAGVSGKVTVRFEYTNNAKVGDVYAPFLMGTGVLLDGEKFSNVTVTNGKVIGDGSRFIVIGVGMPGMSDSLKMDIEGISFPDFMEFEADATDFEMDMALTFASPLVLSEDALDLNIDDLKKEINDKASQYQDGMNQLAEGIAAYTDGVDQLAGGIDQVSSGASDLAKGASQLNDGAMAARSGVAQVYEGAKNAKEGADQLAEGARSAKEGADKLAAGSKSAREGADKLAEGTKDAKNGADKLAEGSKSANEGADKLASGANQLNNAVKDLTLPSLDGAKDNITDEQRAAAAKNIQDTVEAQGYTADKVSEALTKGVTDSLPAAPSFAALADPSLTQEQQAAIIQKEAAAAGQASVTDELKQSIATDAADKAQTAAGQLQADPSKITGNATYQQIYNSVRSSLLDQAYVTAINTALKSNPATETLTYNDLSDEQRAAYKQAVSTQVEAAVDQQMSGLGQALAGAYTAGYGMGYGEGYGLGYGTGFGTGYGTGYGTEYGKLAQEFKAFTTTMSQKMSEGVVPVLTAMCQAYAMAGVNYGMDAVLAEVNTQMTQFNPKIKQLKDATKQLATGSGQLATGMDDLEDGTGKLAKGLGDLQNGTGELAKGLADLENGAGQLSEGLGTLSGGEEQLANGLNDLSSGTAQLNKGLGDLADGTGKLSRGANQLSDGTAQLKTGAAKLTGNSDKLKDGADQLKDATDKIVDAIDKGEVKLEEFKDNFEEIRKAGEKYSSFAGSTSDMKAHVKYIIKTEGITSEE